MTIQIRYTNKEVTIRRYDRENSETKTYKNYSSHSADRLRRFIEKYQYKADVKNGYWEIYECLLDPIARKHCFMLNQEYQKGTMVGQIWTINEEIYWDALECLPPLKYVTNGFLMKEFMIGNITTKFTRYGDQYFCEFVEFTR